MLWIKRLQTVSEEHRTKEGESRWTSPSTGCLPIPTADIILWMSSFKTPGNFLGKFMDSPALLKVESLHWK